MDPTNKKKKSICEDLRELFKRWILHLRTLICQRVKSRSEKSAKEACSFVIVEKLGKKIVKPELRKAASHPYEVAKAGITPVCKRQRPYTRRLSTKDKGPMKGSEKVITKQQVKERKENDRQSTKSTTPAGYSGIVERVLSNNTTVWKRVEKADRRPRNVKRSRRPKKQPQLTEESKLNVEECAGRSAKIGAKERRKDGEGKKKERIRKGRSLEDRLDEEQELGSVDLSGDVGNGMMSTAPKGENEIPCHKPSIGNSLVCNHGEVTCNKDQSTANIQELQAEKEGKEVKAASGGDSRSVASLHELIPCVDLSEGFDMTGHTCSGNEHLTKPYPQALDEKGSMQILINSNNDELRRVSTLAKVKNNNNKFLYKGVEHLWPKSISDFCYRINNVECRMCMTQMSSLISQTPGDMVITNQDHPSRTPVGVSPSEILLERKKGLFRISSMSSFQESSKCSLLQHRKIHSTPNLPNIDQEFFSRTRFDSSRRTELNNIEQQGDCKALKLENGVGIIPVTDEVAFAIFELPHPKQDGVHVRANKSDTVLVRKVAKSFHVVPLSRICDDDMMYADVEGSSEESSDVTPFQELHLSPVVTVPDKYSNELSSVNGSSKELRTHAESMRAIYGKPWKSMHFDMEECSQHKHHGDSLLRFNKLFNLKSSGGVGTSRNDTELLEGKLDIGAREQHIPKRETNRIKESFTKTILRPILSRNTHSPNGNEIKLQSKTDLQPTGNGKLDIANRAKHSFIGSDIAKETFLSESVSNQRVGAECSRNKEAREECMSNIEERSTVPLSTSKVNEGRETSVCPSRKGSELSPHREILMKNNKLTKCKSAKASSIVKVQDVNEKSEEFRSKRLRKLWSTLTKGNRETELRKMERNSKELDQAIQMNRSVCDVIAENREEMIGNITTKTERGFNSKCHEENEKFVSRDKKKCMDERNKDNRYISSKEEMCDHFLRSFLKLQERNYKDVKEFVLRVTERKMDESIGNYKSKSEEYFKKDFSTLSDYIRKEMEKVPRIVIECVTNTLEKGMENLSDRITSESSSLKDNKYDAQVSTHRMQKQKKKIETENKLTQTSYLSIPNLRKTSCTRSTDSLHGGIEEKLQLREETQIRQSDKETDEFSHSNKLVVHITKTQILHDSSSVNFTGTASKSCNSLHDHSKTNIAIPATQDDINCQSKDIKNDYSNSTSWNVKSIRNYSVKRGIGMPSKPMGNRLNGSSSLSNESKDNKVITPQTVKQRRKFKRYKIIKRPKVFVDEVPNEKKELRKFKRYKLIKRPKVFVDEVPNENKVLNPIDINKTISVNTSERLKRRENSQMLSVVLPPNTEIPGSATKVIDQSREILSKETYSNFNGSLTKEKISVIPEEMLEYATNCVYNMADLEGSSQPNETSTQYISVALKNKPVLDKKEFAQKKQTKKSKIITTFNETKTPCKNSSPACLLPQPRQGSKCVENTLKSIEKNIKYEIKLKGKQSSSDVTYHVNNDKPLRTDQRVSSEEWYDITEEEFDSSKDALDVEESSHHINVLNKVCAKPAATPETSSDEVECCQRNVTDHSSRTQIRRKQLKEFEELCKDLRQSGKFIASLKEILNTLSRTKCRLNESKSGTPINPNVSKTEVKNQESHLSSNAEQFISCINYERASVVNDKLKAHDNTLKQLYNDSANYVTRNAQTHADKNSEEGIPYRSKHRNCRSSKVMGGGFSRKKILTASDFSEGISSFHENNEERDSETVASDMSDCTQAKEQEHATTHNETIGLCPDCESQLSTMYLQFGAMCYNFFYQTVLRNNLAENSCCEFLCKDCGNARKLNAPAVVSYNGVFSENEATCSKAEKSIMKVSSNENVSRLVSFLPKISRIEPSEVDAMCSVALDASCFFDISNCHSLQMELRRFRFFKSENKTKGLSIVEIEETQRNQDTSSTFQPLPTPELTKPNDNIPEAISMVTGCQKIESYVPSSSAKVVVREVTKKDEVQVVLPNSSQNPTSNKPRLKCPKEVKQSWKAKVQPKVDNKWENKVVTRSDKREEISKKGSTQREETRTIQATKAANHNKKNVSLGETRKRSLSVPKPVPQNNKDNKRPSSSRKATKDKTGSSPTVWR